VTFHIYHCARCGHITNQRAGLHVSHRCPRSGITPQWVRLDELGGDEEVAG
jgi:hypothetical protein